MSDTNKPADVVRIGPLKVTIWANTTQNGSVFYTTSITRSYRDKDGQWQDSHSFPPHDLLTVAKLADLAHSRIMSLQAGGEQ